MRHAEAILNAGGEDVLCIGSDFDGMPDNPYIASPAEVPVFLEQLARKFGSARAEKFAQKNFLRVFSAV